MEIVIDDFPGPSHPAQIHSATRNFFCESHDAVIRVYRPAGNVVQTHEHKGDFKEW
jgi:hypothetical protein